MKRIIIIHINDLYSIRSFTIWCVAYECAWADILKFLFNFIFAIVVRSPLYEFWISFTGGLRSMLITSLLFLRIVWMCQLPESITNVNCFHLFRSLVCDCFCNVANIHVPPLKFTRESPHYFLLFCNLIVLVDGCIGAVQCSQFLIRITVFLLWPFFLRYATIMWCTKVTARQEIFNGTLPLMRLDIR